MPEVEAVFSGRSASSSSSVAAGLGEATGVGDFADFAAGAARAFSRASFSRAFVFATASAASARLGSTPRSYSSTFIPGCAVSVPSCQTLPLSSLIAKVTGPAARAQ